MAGEPGRALTTLVLRKETEPMQWTAIFAVRAPRFPLTAIHLMLNAPGPILQTGCFIRLHL